jgi:hypothetical protein
MQVTRAIVIVAAACGGTSGGPTDDAASDTGSPDGASATLGTVTGVMDTACPGMTTSLTCKRVTVGGCPGIESEPLDAVVGLLPTTAATVRGTIAHFSGGGGTGFQMGATQAYATAGFTQVFVAWASDWEQTQASGIKTAACRPATIMKWIFDDYHAASRSTAFCGEGFSGGSGQLGYALAHYGLGDYFDYVNELSGPPFTRIDLGCDGDAPATAMVCGATVTMQLPPARLNPWENTTTCGTTGVPAADLAKWNADSIGIGGTYAYPKTRVEFFDCTYQATAVTAMAQLFHDQITSDRAYHCYSQADGCQGEGLGTGNQEAARAMIDGCTPRHQ